jgi:Tol biopolymer transport system component/DNA-binding winged helix-turn-helix (wHTH) protein
MNDRNNSLRETLGDIDPFRIADWLVEPALKHLSRGEESVQVEPRIMHVLTCLARHPGKVISRSDLLEAVWGEVMVNEEALTHAVSQLRRVFDDDPRSPRFIETIHKSGYRLIAPVTWERGDEVAAGAGPGEWPQRHVPRGKRVAIVGILVIAFAAVSILVIRPRLRSSGPPRPIPLVEIPVTSYPGHEICPAISPDGTRIAFSWKQGANGNHDLYIRQKNTETALRLTETEGTEFYAVWSPEGSELAYAFRSEGRTGIYTIPAIGGTPRRVVDLPHGVFGIDWSPDGCFLVYGADMEADLPSRIFLFSLDTGESHPLTRPPPLSLGDFRPVFSPDGRSIAFVRGDRTFLHDIYIIPVGGGEPERITHSQHFVAGLDWMPDGEALVLSSGPTRIADLRLWRLSLKDGSLTWLPTTSHRPIRPSVALMGRGLVYEDQAVSSDILRIRVGEGDEGAVPFITSTRHDYGPQYSPGGRFISFISTRSGSPQIWVCDADGANPKQLTRFERAYIENPCWSYDERRVAFSAAPGNRTAIFVADVTTGEVTRLSTSSGHEKCLGWSRDGQWLYCKSERDESWWVWRIREDGSAVVDIMEKDVFRLAESCDGKRLIYSRADTSGVWSASLDGTDEECIVNGPGTVVPCGWRETATGIYAFSMDEGRLSLWHRDADAGDAAMVASGSDFMAINLDVSPGGEAVIVDHLDILGSDLALVEDFQ